LLCFSDFLTILSGIGSKTLVNNSSSMNAPGCDLDAMRETDSKRSSLPVPFLPLMFCLCVVLLALWRFSENSADPDLWGHVLYGQRALTLGHLERTEPFSWTAPGYRWVNHEVGAEILMGLVHRLLGGPGLLLLSMALGLGTFGLALRMGGKELTWPQRGVVWAVALLAAKEIAFGFAVRPQIFTGAALILLLATLAKIHAGKWKWAFVFPPLFLLWINTHGGALAGICLLFVACGATTAQFLLKKLKPANTFFEEVTLSHLSLWISLLLSALALLCNPCGFELLRWLAGSILWFRPEISEWNPPQFSAEHAGLFALITLSAFAFIFSRQKKWLWEVAIVAALGLVSLRHLRHIPLFSIAALALIPPHLADALNRFEAHWRNLRDLFARAAVQKLFGTLLVGVAAFLLVAIFTCRKERFYTIEVARDEYPLNAIEFIRQNAIKGKMISFFDWGELCLWELPESQVSIDGRLDTCYPRALLREHFKFSNQGLPPAPEIFDIDKADFALLRRDTVGISLLEKHPQWTLAYTDPLAVVFVRDAARFPRLQQITLPVTTSMESLKRREPFPSSPSKAVEMAIEGHQRS
jgi:hypothetical protein